VKPYAAVVARLLKEKRPRSLLDAPCGKGWLGGELDFDCRIEGVDLYGSAPERYARFEAADLDAGLPEGLGRYEAVACCEGLEHLGNPLLFLRSAHRHLEAGGLLVVTTPNVWYPEARLQYLLRGFFPGFPSLAGSIRPGTHMHITPWSFAQLYLYLRLAGFEAIRLHDVPGDPRPKRLYEWLLGLPQYLYCRAKARRARSDEEREYWRDAGRRQSVWGRRLVVSAMRA
jgi:SAM-dependent methyltransferase